MPFLVRASAARSRKGGTTRAHYIFSRKHNTSGGLPYIFTWHTLKWGSCILISSRTRLSVLFWQKIQCSSPWQDYKLKATTHVPHYSHWIMQPSPEEQSHWLLNDFNLSLQSHDSALTQKLASHTHVQGHIPHSEARFRAELMPTAKDTVWHTAYAPVLQICTFRWYQWAFWMLGGSAALRLTQ